MVHATIAVDLARVPLGVRITTVKTKKVSIIDFTCLSIYYGTANGKLNNK